MKESKFLGTLLPSHPDLIPIVQAMREKYNLPEISPDDKPINEIFLGDETVSLEEFRQDIENRLHENLNFFPPETINLYKSTKAISEAQNFQGMEALPDEVIKQMGDLFIALKNMLTPLAQIMDAHIKNIADMLFFYLLTGESGEVPNDSFSQVATIKIMGETMVFAMASQIANPDVIAQQFRETYKKTFGEYHPKITKTATTTAHYLRLKKLGKPWKYIVEEYIRLNKLGLPRDKTSKKYFDTYRRYAQKLKKRIQRTEEIFNVLIGDKK
jgi:hypothetical protein